MVRPGSAVWSAVRLMSRGHGATWAVVQTVVTRALLVALNFGTGIIVARHLGAPGRGELTALIVWPPLLANICSFGIPSALLYHARKRPGERDALFSAAMLIGVGLSAVSIAAGFLILPFALIRYDAATVHLAQLFLFVTPEILLSYIIGALLQVTDRFSFFNQVRFVPVIVTLVGLIAVQSAGALTAGSAAACYLLPSIPMLVWTIWRLRGIASFSFHAFGANLKRLIDYGWRAAGVTILATLAQQVDQILIIALVSATSMGLYVVALSVSRVPLLVFSSVTDVITSKTVGLAPAEITAIVGRYVRSSMATGTLAALALAAIVPLVVPWFYGSDFAAAIRITEVLLVELVATGVAIVLSVAFMAVARPGAVSLLQGGSIVLAVPLMVALIPRLGLMGAALGLVITSLVRLAATIAIYPRIVGTPAPSILPGRDDLRMIVATLRGGESAAAQR